MMLRWLRRLVCRVFGHRLAPNTFDLYIANTFGYQVGDGPLMMSNPLGTDQHRDLYVKSVSSTVLSLSPCTRCRR